MALTKPQKEKIVTEALKSLKDFDAIIFSDFSGIPVSELTNLRRNLSSIEAKYKVIKKTLLNLVLKKNGAEFDFKKLTGPLGVIFRSGELNKVAKTLYEFGKKNESFKILGGFDLKDKKVLDQELIITLAKLPSKEVLLGNLIRALNAPLRNFVNVLEGNLRKLLVVLSNIKPSLK